MQSNYSEASDQAGRIHAAATNVSVSLSLQLPLQSQAAQRRSWSDLRFRNWTADEGLRRLVDAVGVRLLLQSPDLPLRKRGVLSTEWAPEPAGVSGPAHDAGGALVAQDMVAVEQGEAVIAVRVEQLAADGAFAATAVAAQTPDTSTAAGLIPASQFQLLWNRCH